MKLQAVKGSYRQLKEVTGSYRKLQSVTVSYRQLQEVTGSYRQLQAVKCLLWRLVSRVVQSSGPDNLLLINHFNLKFAFL